jgi:hypothetical protein
MGKLTAWPVAGRPSPFTPFESHPTHSLFWLLFFLCFPQTVQVSARPLLILHSLSQFYTRQKSYQPPAVCVTSGFRRHVDETCTLLGCYAASGGNCLLTFRDNLSAPSSGVKKPKKNAALSGSSVSTFRDNLLVPSSRIKSERNAALSCSSVSTFRDTYWSHLQGLSPKGTQL